MTLSDIQNSKEEEFARLVQKISKHRACIAALKQVLRHLEMLQIPIEELLTGRALEYAKDKRVLEDPKKYKYVLKHLDKALHDT